MKHGRKFGSVDGEFQIVMTNSVEVNDWLPGPVEKDAAMPLSVAEVGELYATNLSLTDAEISELTQPLPYLSDLLTVEQFRQLLSEGQALHSSEQRQRVYERTMKAVEDLCGRSSADVVMALRSAIRAKQPREYERALERLAELTKKTKIFRTRNALLAKLAPAAPNWADAIRRREGAHAGGAPPGDAAAAWQWRQSQS